MHDVPLAELLRRAVQRQDLGAGEFPVQGQHAVAAVVAAADGDAFRVQEDVGGVQGGEAGAIADGWGVQEGFEDRFGAGGGWGCFAGVDVGVGGEGGGQVSGGDERGGVGGVAEGGGHVEGWGDVGEGV